MEPSKLQTAIANALTVELQAGQWVSALTHGAALGVAMSIVSHPDVAALRLEGKNVWEAALALVHAAPELEGTPEYDALKKALGL